MHGLANVMMLAASLRGGAMLVPPSAGAGTGSVQVSPYDAKQWGGPVSPWSNALDHDLLYRPKEAKDRVWAEPYKQGKVPLIPIATSGVVYPQTTATAGTMPGILGTTPDGRGVMRDTLLRGGKSSVVVMPIEDMLCKGFYIPSANGVVPSPK